MEYSCFFCLLFQVSLLAAWRYPRQLGGVVALSGWLTLKDEFVQEKAEDNDTPLCKYVYIYICIEYQSIFLKFFFVF